MTDEQISKLAEKIASETPKPEVLLNFADMNTGKLIQVKSSSVRRNSS